MTSMAIDYDKLPEHIRPGFQEYIEHRIQPGGFIMAVLCNNLVESFGRADEINQGRLFDIVSFLYNEAPSICWGSQEKVEAWLAEG